MPLLDGSNGVTYPNAPEPLNGLNQGMLSGLNAGMMINQEKERKVLMTQKQDAMKREKMQQQLVAALQLTQQPWVPKNYKLALLNQNIRPYFESAGMQLPEMTEWPEFGDKLSKDINDILEKSKKLNNGKGLPPQELQTLIAVKMMEYEPELHKRIEPTLAALKNQGEQETKTRELDIRAKEAENKAGLALTPGQKKLDQTFAADYASYTAGGGYADVVSQVQTLQDVLDRLEAGKENLTGPILTMQWDATRKRLNPKSMEAQQAVEQSVQRTLKQTLGGQFTEREGMLFMQRGYDPTLPEKANAEKLRKMLGSLKSIAKAKQAAVDYFEEKGTLQGFKGTLYALKDGSLVEASKSDMDKIMSQDGSGGQAPIFIKNPTTGERKKSVDGGKSWQPAQ